METETLLWNYLTSLARQIPIFLVYLIGIILALVWIRKHTKASIFLIIAIVILFFNSVTMTGIYMWLPNYLRDLGISPADYDLYYLVIGIVSNLIEAVAFILILLAVFSGRSAHSNY